MSNDVVNDERSQQYQMKIDGNLAVAEYERSDDVVTFTHTFVPEALRGHGAATRLVAGALDDVRAHHLKVVPQCPMVAAYMDRHPETKDLLAPSAAA